MSDTKKASKQNIRRPYEKVSKTIQVPDGLLEISWLAAHGKDGNGQVLPPEERLEKILKLSDSIYETVTGEPGCLSNMSQKTQVLN